MWMLSTSQLRRSCIRSTSRLPSRRGSTFFCEKPAGVDVAGCKRVIAAARKADKTKRISFDYQQRYGVDYNRAYDIVKQGGLGKMAMIRAAWIGGGLPLRSGHPQNEEKIRNWLYYPDYSGDIIVEQNCHNLDVVNWFTGTHPVKASGYGNRALRKQREAFSTTSP